MHNKRNFGQPYQVELKSLSKELLVAKKKAQETFLRSVLRNEGRIWTGFYKYVKRYKEKRENILAIRDHNGKVIADPIEKTKSLKCFMRLNSVAIVITHKINQHNQVNPSPLVLTL